MQPLPSRVLWWLHKDQGAPSGAHRDLALTATICKLVSPTETRLLLTFPQKVQTIQENANKKRTLEAASQRADALGGRGGQQTIQASFGKGDKEQLLDLAADFFYGCGLSFNVTNNPYFKAYIAGVSAAPPGHKPPSYYQLRVPLLARAKARLAPKLAAFLAAATTQQQQQ